MTGATSWPSCEQDAKPDCFRSRRIDAITAASSSPTTTKTNNKIIEAFPPSDCRRHSCSSSCSAARHSFYNHIVPGQFSTNTQPRLFPNATFTSSTQMLRRSVMLILLVGAEAVYFDTGLAPSLQALATGSARPRWTRYMQPFFPKLTFPNYSPLLTGLFSLPHGVVVNDFHDGRTGQQLYYTISELSWDAWVGAVAGVGGRSAAGCGGGGAHVCRSACHGGRGQGEVEVVPEVRGWAGSGGEVGAGGGLECARCARYGCGGAYVWR